MQTTVAKEVEFSGIGLHSGKDFKVVLKRAPKNTGVQFRRADIAVSPYTRITAYNVTSTQLATTINCGDFPISTIEHLMASLYGLQIDNVFVDVYGAEIPILDGSAVPIIKALLSAGIEHLDAPSKILKVVREFEFISGDKIIRISPSDSSLEIDFTLDYEDKFIGKQVYSYKHSSSNFVSEIAFARTFGFKHEVEALWSMGLARGGSLENAVVIGESCVLNPEGLRINNEFVRHKILDMLGDLSLIGYRLIGKITAIKAGHNINNQFARKLLESTNSYEILTEKTKTQPVLDRKHLFVYDNSTLTA